MGWQYIEDERGEVAKRVWIPDAFQIEPRMKEWRSEILGEFTEGCKHGIASESDIKRGEAVKCEFCGYWTTGPTKARASGRNAL